MTLNQIDQAAFDGIDIMTRLMDDIDKLYYLAVKSMYEAYRAGGITQDEATARKNQLRALHSRFDIDRKIYRQHQAIEAAFGGYRKNLETCDCEHCRKMLRLIDGREIQS